MADGVVAAQVGGQVTAEPRSGRVVPEQSGDRAAVKRNGGRAAAKPSSAPAVAVPSCGRMVAVLAVVVGLGVGVAGCSVDASQATPESKVFPFQGKSLDVRTHEIATDLVAVDRRDVKVTRWFDAAAGSEHLSWELKGGVLDIDAGCSGLAICDAKFRVEVPEGVTVLRDGRKTGLRGGS
ncbi:hypothetical protein [Streptomyces sp. NPDC045470]|uniref:hypothetical protein n=1 Tax=unclassified Streptomyces TaxID=2593676 RepID=UPI0033EF0C2B